MMVCLLLFDHENGQIIQFFESAGNSNIKPYQSNPRLHAHTQADAIPQSGLKTHAAHLVVFCTVFEDQANIGHKLLDRLVVLGIPQLQLLLHLL